MIWRVRSRRTFAELRARGERVRSGPVRMTYLGVAAAQPQVAFAFGRRFGTAVERNRARRRLRVAFATSWHAVAGPPGVFLLSGSRSVLTADFASLVDACRACLLQLGSGSLVGGGRAPASREPSAALGRTSPLGALAGSGHGGGDQT